MVSPLGPNTILGDWIKKGHKIPNEHMGNSNLVQVYSTYPVGDSVLEFG